MATHDPTELAWSENPESITIGEAETVSFKFKYYSLYQNKISISISPETTEKIKTPSLTREIVGKDYWATVTVAGNIKGSGNVELTVVTYQTMSITSKKITKIKVVKATNAIQIKFFDTDNKPLANNKLIAPKYICDISQGEDDPNKGSKPSTSNKCLKTTDRKEYVRFKYKEPIGPTIYDTSVCSWVTLSDSFDLPMWRSGCICLNGIIDETSRNITRDML